jgi:hypothetical protein
MSQLFDEARDDVTEALWWAGWRPKIAILAGLIAGTFVGVAVDAIALLVMLGLCGGVAWWYTGTRHINDHYEEVLKAYFNDAERHSRDILSVQGEDVELFTLRHKHGSMPLVKAAKVYEPTTLGVGDTSVTFYDDTALDMVNLDVRFDTNTQEIFYDQVAGVQYTEPFLEVKNSANETMEFRSSRKPDDALNLLQNQVRTYKRAGARQAAGN